MESWLSKFYGSEVEVLYLTDNNVYKDRGRLADMGDGWIELHKPNGEVFLVPATAIRLLKVLGGPRSEETTLLRPVPYTEADEEGVAAVLREEA